MAEDNKNQKSAFSEEEEKVIEFWKEGDIFKKSVEKEAPKGNYVFYDGPPFITGLPHYATLLPSIAKDVIPRFFTMKGYRVDRVWGWDCHGLPAENKVEEKLNLKNKKDIEDMGVGEFVAACRDYVSTSSKQWEWYIERIGRWVDMKNAYKTMDIEFMESAIWAFKELYENGFIYEGYRTSLHCPRCATPLSKFEVTMDAGSYREVEDDSVIVKFEMEKGIFLLAWTTTPWTLPGNLALAVGKDIDYTLVEFSGDRYFLASEKVKEIFEGKEYKVIEKTKGKKLVGSSYKPLFDPAGRAKESDTAFKVYSADFVSTQEGTGIVHIAPGFGEDDFELGKKEKLPIIELMDENGVYTENAGKWSGYYFKEANEKVKEDLGERLFRSEKSVHSYPFCYRCDTSLIHKTQKAWYLNVEAIRKEMLESNKEVNWVPDHFKEGRFKYNLENAPDWCLSRSRYWGSPIPIWRCREKECNNLKVIGSIKELENLSGKEVNDLHRPLIDEVTFSCTECSGEMRRVPEVLDCWFESGSMPFAQFHYPFERKDEWEELFPADFIIEYTGQLRGWFYYLHVLSNALFKSHAFKNVIVTGVLAGDDGRKMSKSLGNYPDPRIVLDKYGSDALRMYFMSSPIMTGGDMNLSEEDIKDSLRKNVILLGNILNFYETFAKEDGFYISKTDPELPSSDNVLDKWIVARLSETVGEIEKSLESYVLPPACKAITTFIDDFSTWYIRRSRERFKGEEREEALYTTGFVLYNFSKAVAPVMPFIAERIWQKVTGNDFKEREASVHLTDYPYLQKEIISEETLSLMKKAREIVSVALKERADEGIKVRQPLSSLTVPRKCGLEGKEEFLELIKEEVNVKEVLFDEKLQEGVVLDKKITPELKEEGEAREIVRTVQNLRKRAGLVPGDKVDLFYEGKKGDDIIRKWENHIKKTTGVANITEKKEAGLDAEKKIEMDKEDLFLGIKKRN